VIIAFVTISLLGVVPALFITRSLVVGTSLSAAVAIVIASIATIFGVIAGTSIVLIATVLAAIINLILIALWFIVGRKNTLQPFKWLPNQELLAGVLILLPTIALFMLFRPLPVDWDPRSIWWFHASGFLSGGQTAHSLISNPLYSFAHMNYPPGDSAVIATAWFLSGAKNLFVAESITALLTALSTSLFTLLLVRKRSLIIFALGILLVASVAGFGIDQGPPSGGYVDTLCATLTCAALVAYLCIENAKISILLGSIALAGAALSKGEGLYFGVAIILIAIVFAPKAKLRILVWSAIALLPAFAWQLLVHHINPTVGVDVNFSNFLSLFDSRSMHRLPIAWNATFGAMWPICFASLAVVTLTWIVQVHARGLSACWTTMRPVAALMVASFLTSILIVFIYTVGNPDITWWLESSLARVVTTPRILALGSVVLAVSATLDALPFPSQNQKSIISSSRTSVTQVS
jgi:hypothetical protein